MIHHAELAKESMFKSCMLEILLLTMQNNIQCIITKSNCFRCIYTLHLDSLVSQHSRACIIIEPHYTSQTCFTAIGIFGLRESNNAPVIPFSTLPIRICPILHSIDSCMSIRSQLNLIREFVFYSPSIATTSSTSGAYFFMVFSMPPRKVKSLTLHPTHAPWKRTRTVVPWMLSRLTSPPSP